VELVAEGRRDVVEEQVVMVLVSCEVDKAGQMEVAFFVIGRGDDEVDKDLDKPILIKKRDFYFRAPGSLVVLSFP
jgi:hypothetical protein